MSEEYGAEDPHEENDLNELLLDVADQLEMAAVDLQNEDVEAAGYGLRNAAWQIQRTLEEDEDK